jgi:hypothetical protein
VPAVNVKTKDVTTFPFFCLPSEDTLRSAKANATCSRSIICWFEFPLNDWTELQNKPRFVGEISYFNSWNFSIHLGFCQQDINVAYDIIRPDSAKHDIIITVTPQLPGWPACGRPVGPDDAPCRPGGVHPMGKTAGRLFFGRLDLPDRRAGPEQDAPR